MAGRRPRAAHARWECCIFLLQRWRWVGGAGTAGRGAARHGTGLDTDTASASPACLAAAGARAGHGWLTTGRGDHAPRSRVRPCPARGCFVRPQPAVVARLCLSRGNKCISHPGCLETARLVGVVPRTNSTTLPKRCSSIQFYYVF